jgi:hypothetical protein
VKVRTFNIQKYEQKPSTFKKNNKNRQHSKTRVKTFNLFKSKDKNLQPLKAKTKAFDLSKNENKNLQPLKEKNKNLEFFEE